MGDPGSPMEIMHGIGPAGTPVAVKVSADGTMASDLSIDETALATSAKQDTGNTSLGTAVSTLASILAKILTAPATEAKQDTGNTSLASILAKIIAAPATEAKQDTGNTSLASILAKIIAAPATEAKQDTGNTSLASLVTLGGGTGKAIIRGGAKGATTASDVTSTANGADHQGCDTSEQFAPAAEDNTNGVMATMSKPLNASTYCHTLYTNFAGSATKANIKNAAGNVFAIVVTNSNAAIRYFLIHNKASAPAAGEAGLLAFPVPASGSITLGAQWFSEAGDRFGTGIGWSIGTTVATFTDSATAGEHTVQVKYL